MDPQEINNGRMPYGRQVRHAKWQEKCAEIKKRDGWRCTDCGSQDNLTVHHRMYCNDLYLWQYPDDLLVSLCWECHQKRQIVETSAHVVMAKLIGKLPLRALEEAVYYWVLKATAGGEE